MGALGVRPAETRLTVYRRPPIRVPGRKNYRLRPESGLAFDTLHFFAAETGLTVYRRRAVRFLVKENVL